VQVGVDQAAGRIPGQVRGQRDPRARHRVSQRALAGGDGGGELAGGYFL
jgi:hypothetical protein